MFKFDDLQKGSIRLGHSGSEDVVISFGWNGIDQDAFRIQKFAHMQHTNPTDLLYINANGNVGIGTTSPRGLFDIGGSGDIYLSNSTTTGTPQAVYLPGNIYISPYNGSNISYLQARRSDNSGNTSLQIRTYNSGNLVDAMLIDQNGNVAIGTSDAQGYKLAVNGDAIFTKVKVKTHSTWPDYVFHRSYKLRPLKDLESYIKKNNHLPDIPSTNEVKKNGLDLGDNQALLLRKIEELTLYIIDQDKKIAELQGTNKKVEEQRKSIESLTKQVEALKSLLGNK